MQLSEITYDTKYGKIIVPSNDQYFVEMFNNGEYWSDEEIKHNISIIDKSKNILEFGSHVGTHTIPYAKNIKDNCKVYSFEPQKAIYDILQKNIVNNDLLNKVIAHNSALFYYNGTINMNSTFLDGDFTGEVNNSKDVNCNYGGLSIGSNGESTSCYKIDDLVLENLGFIHSDSQGSEPLIFWGARETISKFKPIIFYENANYEVDNTPKKNIYIEIIKDTYNVEEDICNFDIALFCMQELGYRTILKGYNTYLIP